MRTALWPVALLVAGLFALIYGIDPAISHIWIWVGILMITAGLLAALGR